MTDRTRCSRPIETCRFCTGALLAGVTADAFGLLDQGLELLMCGRGATA